jgi:preprotein translocase subunit SecA
MRFGNEASQFNHTPESVQRSVEGQNLDIRVFLQKYERVIEGQRQMIQHLRQEVLTGGELDLERLVRLRTIDDRWSDHLAAVAELRSGVHWVSWAGRDPYHEYMKQVDVMYRGMMDGLEDEVARRVAEAEAEGIDPSQRGATWTYLTTDQPFGTWTERITRGLMRLAQERAGRQ